MLEEKPDTVGIFSPDIYRRLCVRARVSTCALIYGVFSSKYTTVYYFYIIGLKMLMLMLNRRPTLYYYYYYYDVNRSEGLTE